jgi:hypothetical protein
MIDINDLERLRPCGRLETYSTARHHLGYYNNVGLTATYNSPTPSSNSLEASIYAALRHVIAKHPVLSVIPLNEDKSFPNVYFAHLPTIDLTTCVGFRERKATEPQDGEVDEELDHLLAEEHARNFKDDLGTKPFWRLAVLTSATRMSTFTASWTFHHALSDGASALLFHETLLAAMNSLDPNPETDPIVKPPTRPLPPAFEDLHPLPISWPFFLGTLAKLFLPSVFNKRPEKLWTGNPVPSEIPSPPIFHFRTLVFSAKITQRLLEASREQGVSVTCTLECLLAASLFKHLPAGQINQIKFTAPMAMRRFLEDVPPDQITNALTQYEFTHHRPSTPATKHGSKIPQNFSWSDAHAVKSAIATQLAKSGTDNPVALFKYVSSMHDYVNGHLGKPRSSSVELSNIGVYKNKTDGGKWQIGRVTFSQCANPTGAAICVNVVTGGDGCASVSFCWFDGAVVEELVGKVLEGLREGVDGLIGEDGA